eukprot:TRINITY_DN4404_c0_g1_i2.p1 TRINITY_DN4404_c0_g1~~TRINITY_DN4404_c0_g1_i2.p1  ORF type:complete len:550 (-),score=126.42 TRINITY_DN4404_c0_g1_i2:79-1728(-)
MQIQRTISQVFVFLRKTRRQFREDDLYLFRQSSTVEATGADEELSNTEMSTAQSPEDTSSTGKTSENTLEQEYQTPITKTSSSSSSDKKRREKKEKKDKKEKKERSRKEPSSGHESSEKKHRDKKEKHSKSRHARSKDAPGKEGGLFDSAQSTDSTGESQQKPETTASQPENVAAKQVSEEQQGTSEVTSSQGDLSEISKTEAIPAVETKEEVQAQPESPTKTEPAQAEPAQATPAQATPATPDKEIKEVSQDAPPAETSSEPSKALKASTSAEAKSRNARDRGVTYSKPPEPLTRSDFQTANGSHPSIVNSISVSTSFSVDQAEEDLTDDSQTTVPMSASVSSVSELHELEFECVPPGDAKAGIMLIANGEIKRITRYLSRGHQLNLRLCCQALKKALDENCFNVMARLHLALNNKDVLSKIARTQNLVGVHFDYRNAPLETLVPLLPSNLKKLNLSWCNCLTDQVFKSLSTSLEQLDISHCELKDSFFPLLPSSLKVLRAGSSNITDDNLKSMSHLKNLTTLDLSYTGVSQSGVQALPKSLVQIKLR